MDPVQESMRRKESRQAKEDSVRLEEELQKEGQEKSRQYNEKNAGESARRNQRLMEGFKAKSKGKSKSKPIQTTRHRKVLRDSILGITKPAVRRLCRRGGVKRISGKMYEETRGVLRLFLEKVVSHAVTYCEHARRKTVSVFDVLHALKFIGRTLYYA